MDSLNELDISLDVDRIVNLAQITLYPVETAGAVQVLWTARSTLHVAPGSTRIIYGNFHDDNGERVGATGVVSPVASTDYTYEYNGVDVTAWGVLTVAATIEATRVKWTLTNTSGWATLDVDLLQIRGKPVRVYDPITLEKSDTTSQTAYEVRAQRLDLPMQSDLNLVQSYTEYVIGRFAEPIMVCDRLVIEDRAVIEGVNIFALDLMGKIAVTDYQTGLSAAAHWIRGVEYDIRAGGSFTTTFHLERADDRIYCILDKVGYCELDSVRVGF